MKLLVIGSNGGIGAALVDMASSQAIEVCAASREVVLDANVQSLQVNLLDQPEIFEAWLAEQAPDAVVSCAGMLSNQFQLPEKKLQSLDVDFFEQNMRINCLVHLTVAQVLERALARHVGVKFLCLSARVGSIEDNALGGWYSYRMSKAALNMGVKNLAIEWQRTRPKWSVAAIHPGTTATALSAPFQAGVAADKLYSPALTAERILAVLQSLSTAQSGSLLNWDGEPLPY